LRRLGYPSSTVKGPGDEPFEAAVVIAQNTSTKITVDVLSGKDGRYRVEKESRHCTWERIRSVSCGEIM
jgi:hypothetical protein